MEKTLTSLFGSISNLKAHVNNEDIDDYELYEILGEIKDICTDYRNSLSGEDISKENCNGTRYTKYLSDAIYLMMKDAADYINDYIDSHDEDLKGTEYYIIRAGSTSTRLICISDSHRVNMKEFKAIINKFPGRTIFDILGIQKKTILIKKDYNRFLEIRKDKEYIVPYIQEILDRLHMVEEKHNSKE